MTDATPNPYALADPPQRSTNNLNVDVSMGFTVTTDFDNTLLTEKLLNALAGYQVIITTDDGVQHPQVELTESTPVLDPEGKVLAYTLNAEYDRNQYGDERDVIVFRLDEINKVFVP